MCIDTTITGIALDCFLFVCLIKVLKVGGVLLRPKQ